MTVTRTQRKAEIAAVLLTAAGHLSCHILPIPRHVFIPVVVGLWGLYAVYRGGISNRNFAAAWRPLAIFGVISIVAMAAVGGIMGTFTLQWHLWVALAVYPIWGVIQQYLVQDIVARNLKDLNWNPMHVTLMTAALFGLIHLPFGVLMAATFVLGLVFTPHYLRYGNVPVLGLWHGWLGTFLYYWVLGRDPLAFLG